MVFILFAVMELGGLEFITKNPYVIEHIIMVLGSNGAVKIKI